MFGALDISTSGMVAQRTRLEVVSANIANQGTLLDAQGRLSPYQRRFAVLAPGNPGDAPGARPGDAPGVRVVDIAVDQSPPRLREYNPDSPVAFKDGPFKGYVAETNINSTIEQINAMEAVRAYEANVMAAEATKQMIAATLRLLGSA